VIADVIADQPAAPSVLPRPTRPRRRAGAWLSRHPAWPVVALLAGYPLWWALGVADFMWIILAIPMAARLYAWRAHRSRPVRLPPGFGLWLLFLIWSIAGGVMLPLQAPGTVASPVSHRFVAFADRTTTYIAITVLLIYVGNLTQSELPKRKLMWLLGLLGGYATLLGIAGMVMPNFQFDSPTLVLIPHSLQHNAFILAQMHPALTQVQDVFSAQNTYGTTTGQGRPKAPFDYTNTWGECLTITVPWLLLVSMTSKRRPLRLAGLGVTFLALVALVYSLNRSAWIAVAVSVVYLAVRLAARGRVAMLGGLVAALVVAVVVVVSSPLGQVVSLRLQNGKSNSIRSSLFALSMRDGLSSPLLGYGDTRQQRGSVNSVAIGPTPGCPICGQAEVGSTGQFSLVLICSGFVGVALYFGFFLWGVWRFRRDRTPDGMLGMLVIVLSFVYMLTYDAVAAPLGLTMLAYAVLWRNDMQLARHAGPGQMPRPRRLARRTTVAAGRTPEATAIAR
jgi:O-Antigen ligase